MKFKDYKEEIEIPEGVEVTVSEGNLIYVKGEKGEIKRALRDPKIKISVENNKVIIFVKVLTKNEKTMVGTFKSHIKNMLKGVKEPYVYKLKICSGHFPMNVSYSNNELSVKNFIGEKIPRKLKIQQGVDLKVEGDIITVTHINKEVSGQTAASIEQLCKRPGFDRRIFQPGIYITEKAGKIM